MAAEFRGTIITAGNVEYDGARAVFNGLVDHKPERIMRCVDADDVAAAITEVLERRAAGAFNLASGRPVTTEVIARALGARPVHLPARVVRAGLAALWHLRLEQVDPGWVDLAYAVPLLDSSRAERELGWRPLHNEADVIEELIDGMARSDSAPSPILRPRRVRDNLRHALADGPVHRRLRP